MITPTASKRRLTLTRIARASVIGMIAAAAACSTDAEPVDHVAQAPLSANASAKIGLMLHTLQAKGGSPSAMPKGLLKARSKGGVTYVDVLIEGDTASIAGLQGLGVEIRTVTSAGIMTASLPLPQLNAAAALSGVKRITAARQVKMYNDRSQALDTSDPDATFGMNNDRSLLGEDVIVGVLDSGLDWTHEDFIDDTTGESRIVAYWDQSDITDSAPPAAFSYGVEYDKADFDAYNIEGDTSRVAASAKDTDGHGTHVTGTAAGDGSASGGLYKGGAPAADIVFVKFDFDGDRNSTAAIVDGIQYIFDKAEQLGKPAVINMSLGSDFGPHDGTTLEERGIDALTGPGKVVVVAAGNPGSNNWSEELAWGYAMHGSGQVGTDTIEFRLPSGLQDRGADADYAFLSIWHDEGTCTIDVSYEGSLACQLTTTTTPGYVNSCRFSGKNKIYIGQSSDIFGYESDSGSTESYVELPPVTGTYQIDIHSCSGGSGDGTYHATHGVSGNVVRQYRAEPTPRSPTPTYGGRQSDNAVTIGNPASANNVIAVAAYQSRNEWDYIYGINNDSLVCDGTSVSTQGYGVYPIHYYDPYALGELAYFSGRGPRRDGVLKPEIAAPGVGIISAFSSHAQELEVGAKCTDYWDSGSYHYGTNRVVATAPGGTPEKYTVLQGTSMACPNATGAIALLLESKPDLTAAQLRVLFGTSARVDATVTDYDNTPFSAGSDTDLSGGAPNDDWGYGKLDVGLSVAALPSCSAACLYDSDCGVGGTCELSASLSSCSQCTGGCEATETDEVTCDGVDNDCDGQIDEGLANACGGCATLASNPDDACGDCGTVVCSGADATSCDDPGLNLCGQCGAVPAEVCDDGVDNDCDGDTDGADSDCAPACSVAGTSCSNNGQCCSNNCKGKPGEKTCK